MGKSRKMRGITLIALVVTIILLLILAGVSLQLIGGSNGILQRASQALDKNNVATAKEQVELMLSDYQTDFFEEKYVTRTKDGTKKDYILDKLKGETSTKDYRVSASEEGKVAVYEKNGSSRGPVATGSVQEEGWIKWDDEISEDVPSVPTKPEKASITIMSGEQQENGWYTSVVRMEIKGSKYTINGKEMELENGVTEITISEDGVHEIKAYLVNENDETLEETSVTIQKDTVEPEDFTPIDGIGNGTGKQIEISAKTEDTSGISEYRYYLNNEYIATTKNEKYTITGLNPFVDYEVYVVAKDNVGKEKQSETIKFNTGVYLYNNGDECVAVTGGWRIIYKSSAPGDRVAKASQIELNRSNYMNYIIYPDDNYAGAALGTSNKINITNYKYMCSKAQVALARYSGACVCLLAMDFGGECVGPDDGTDEYAKTICYEKEIKNKTTFQWDISGLRGETIPVVYLQTSYYGDSVANIYEIWLLK